MTSPASPDSPLSQTQEITAFLESNLSDFDGVLQQVVDRTEPLRLYDPARYILDGQGKRFRPQLVLAASACFGGDRLIALQAAAAVEVFHIFTLVHDDIMDKSDTRRGRTTIHVKWDEPTAILTGDYLLGKSVDLLLSFPDASLRKVLSHFTDTVRLLCEGQVRDMAFETRDDVTLEDYVQMIDEKTSALLQCALVLGGYSGSANDAEISKLSAIGHHLGQAFQIQDDYLDLMADSENWGKPIGGDLVAGKKTYLLLKAVEEEAKRGESWFTDIMKRGGADTDAIPEARDRMRELGVTDTTRLAVIFHSGEAQRLIDELPKGIGQASLAALTHKMQHRLH